MNSVDPRPSFNRRAAGLIENQGFRDDIEALRIAVLRRRFRGSDSTASDIPTAQIQRNTVVINRAVRKGSRQTNEPPNRQLRDAALFAARTYENLAEGDSRQSQSLLLTSAVNYQIAGYQANAATLARLAARIPPYRSKTVPNFAELASIFLQRRFLRMALAPESALEVRGDALTEANVIEAARLVTQKGLSHASRYFLSGDLDEVSRAQTELDLAYGALLDLGAVLEANLVDGLAALIPGFTATSIWTNLSNRLPKSRLWTRYLKALGRGFSSVDIMDSRSVSELWPSQLGALEEGLLESGSRVVRMPTSAGKTRVAEMAIIHSLASRPQSSALYIAPFNALTDELATGFNDLFVDLGLTVSSISGSYEIDDVSAVALEEDLLVVTPEKLDQLMRVESSFLSRVEIIILDEGHIVSEAGRGVKYELSVSRLRQLRPDATFIALSAVVPDSTLAQFSRWLKASAAPIASSWRPTQVRTAQLVTRNDSADLVYPDPKDLIKSLIVPDVIKVEDFEFRHPETRRIRRKRFPELTHRAQMCAAMAYTVVDQGPVLVYCAQPDFAQAVADALMDRINYALWSDIDLPNQFRAEGRLSALVAEEWLGVNHKLTQQLRYGVAVHHASIPTAVQRAIEDDFRNRRIAALAATSTLAQGVNFPVRTLVVHSTRRWDEATSSRAPMLARDFWNIAGRVGRAGTETEGTVVFLTANSEDQRDFERYLSLRDNVEPVQSALTQLLQRLIAERISREEMHQLLDADLLALLVEETGADLTAADLQNHLGETLFEIQAADRGQDSSPLWGELATTAQSILSRVPEHAERQLFSVTGLSVVSNIALRDHAIENRHALEAHFVAGDLESPLALLEIMIGGLTLCPEMTPRRDTDVNHLEVLESWLQGDAVAIMAHNLDTDPIRLTRFIEDYLGYRLPWGTSAYLQIAAKQFGFEAIPEHLRALPMLVKYGVPNSASSWLMALGMPSRRTASLMASKYLERTDTPSIGGLRRWLSRLNVETLTTTLQLPAESIDYAARVVLRAHGNDLLKRYYSGDSRLGVIVRTASFTLSPANAHLRTSLRVGGLLDVERDRDAPYRNSCALHVGGHFLCRLPRRTCDMLALEIDCGMQFKATILEVRVNSEDSLSVRVDINHV